MPIRKMLLPVSFDPSDSKMLSFACGLSRQGVRELVVAHVVDSSGVEPPVIIRGVERARERLLEMVSGLSKECGLEIEVRVVTGKVLREITALAHETNVDVVCCGTEGKSFVDYLFSGSVSEDLALKGDERTMTVRLDLLESVEQARRRAADFARQLVVPTDFSGSAMRAFLSAFYRPAEAIGAVHLLHIADDDEGSADVGAQLRGMASMAAHEHGVEVVTAIREGDAPQAVLDYIDEVGGTGVITGRRGRSTLTRGLLGSVSMKLMQDAPCPVVIQP